MQASIPEYPQRTGNAGASWPSEPQATGFTRASFSRRILAYLVDLVMIGLIIGVLALAFIALSLLTLGLSLLFIWPVWAATPFVYSGLTLSSGAQATLGMRLMGLQMRQLDGARIDFFTGLGHALLFYIFGATMTPFILLVGLLRRDHALLHDLVLRVRIVSLY